MTNKNITIISILLINVILLSACQYQIISLNSKRVVWLKDYAFCRCLDYSFGDSIKAKINEIDHSKSTLIDISEGWSFHNQIDSSARAYVTSIPEPQILDYKGQKPYIASCLEFWRSEQLDLFIKGLLSQKNK